jgi:HD-GYP domain-containing protein (c-di-GMP phosphodiesterase class II)
VAVDRFGLRLASIARLLGSERRIDRLLSLILQTARELSGADAGSIYVVEGEGAARRLRFKITQNDSVSVDLREFELPVDATSMVGRCALERGVVAVADAYAPGAEASHDRSIDERLGYRTRSIIAVPMVSARDEVIGVVQLINKKRRPGLPLRSPAAFERNVVAFGTRDEERLAALAGQAGVALENALLYDEIQRLFEGFVRASVQAIEARDPTTAGHSERVAVMTRELARAASLVDTGPLAAVRFDEQDLREIEYAGLLHDFGKVGVREHVLVKAKKLYEKDRDLVLARFAYVKKSLENAALERKLALHAGGRPDAAALAAVDLDLAHRLREVDAHARFVLECNEPTVLAEGGFERLRDVAAIRWTDAQGEDHPLLTVDEVETLSVRKGSLTMDERLEIESHVVHTESFLRRIPWSRQLRDVPDIAGAHHEKLDGTGYPRKLRGAAIPIQSRMMTIADIYDALTASDRPYKRALPTERALDILSEEVRHGRCDADLFHLFVEARVWLRAHGTPPV